jgi:hypothetical protein
MRVVINNLFLVDDYVLGSGDTSAFAEVVTIGGTANIR